MSNKRQSERLNFEINTITNNVLMEVEGFAAARKGQNPAKAWQYICKAWWYAGLATGHWFNKANADARQMNAIARRNINQAREALGMAAIDDFDFYWESYLR